MYNNFSFHVLHLELKINTLPFSQDLNQTGNGVGVTGTRRQSAKTPSLKRGNSFMERGEKRIGNDGGKLSVGTTHRPNSVRIGSKSAAEPLHDKGATNSSGRVRSLVSFHIYFISFFMYETLLTHISLTMIISVFVGYFLDILNLKKPIA